MKFLYIIIVVVGLNTQVFSQNLFENFKLIKGKPSVYISYSSQNNNSLNRTDRNKEIFWFSIHNNTKNSISLCQYDSSVSLTGKIGLHYEIEKSLNKNDLSTRDNSNIPIGFPTFDFCNEYDLKSGRSFVFGVLGEHLVKGTRLKIKFYFPWENVFESRIGGEPAHYVYFYEIDLPRLRT